MPSSLFPSQQNAPQPQQPQSNNIFNAINQVKNMMNGDPQTVVNNMLNSNPKFRQFAQSMQGKTPEQAFKEFGLDFNQIRGFFG